MNEEKVNQTIADATKTYYSIVEPLKLEELRNVYYNQYLNDKNPLITVYTPTYNRVEMLKTRSVKSVLDQTYTNYEYVIIGDSCTDQTEEYVTSLGDNRIKFWNIPRRWYRYPPTAFNHWLAGPVCAANFALQLVRGKWIARIDDDDVWVKDHLETLLRYAQEHDYEFVSGRSFSLDENGSKVEIPITHRAYQLHSYLSVMSSFDLNREVKAGSPSSWLYRTYLKYFRYNEDCWRKNNNRVNDTDFLERIYEMGVRIGFVDAPVMYYYPRPGELAGSAAYLGNASVMENIYKFDT